MIPFLCPIPWFRPRCRYRGFHRALQLARLLWPTLISITLNVDRPRVYPYSRRGHITKYRSSYCPFFFGLLARERGIDRIIIALRQPIKWKPDVHPFLSQCNLHGRLYHRPRLISKGPSILELPQLKMRSGHIREMSRAICHFPPPLGATGGWLLASRAEFRSFGCFCCLLPVANA